MHACRLGGLRTCGEHQTAKHTFCVYVGGWVGGCACALVPSVVLIKQRFLCVLTFFGSAYAVFCGFGKGFVAGLLSLETICNIQYNQCIAWLAQACAKILL